MRAVRKTVLKKRERMNTITYGSYCCFRRVIFKSWCGGTKVGRGDTVGWVLISDLTGMANGSVRVLVMRYTDPLSGASWVSFERYKELEALRRELSPIS